MRWFNRWLARRVEAAMNDRRGLAIRSEPVPAVDNADLNSRGMIFHLYAAVGGTVIEVREYDPKLDRATNRLYIIPEGTDFNETLTQIVSMERIKAPH